LIHDLLDGTAQQPRHVRSVAKSDHDARPLPPGSEPGNVDDFVVAAAKLLVRALSGSLVPDRPPDAVPAVASDLRGCSLLPCGRRILAASRCEDLRRVDTADFGWVYEFTIVEPHGHRREVLVDGRTSRILRSEGR